MIHLDNLEQLNGKTPWAPKNLFERAKLGVETVEKAIALKKVGLKLKFFSSEADSFTKFLFALVQEKTIGEGKNHLLISASLRATFKETIALFEPFGIVCETIPLTCEGIVNLELLHSAIYPTTMGCILEPYDSITGVVQPVEKVCEILGRERHLHLVSTSSFGLQGLGARVSSMQIGPMLMIPHGWPLPSTFDLDQIVALTSTFQENLEKSQEQAMHLSYLRRFFERSLEAMGAKIFFKEQQRAPGVVVFGFEGLHGELLAYNLCQKGIFVSIGGGDRPSLHAHLTRMEIEEQLAVTAVHICLHPDHDELILQKVIDAIREMR